MGVHETIWWAAKLRTVQRGPSIRFWGNAILFQRIISTSSTSVLSSQESRGLLTVHTVCISTSCHDIICHFVFAPIQYQFFFSLNLQVDMKSANLTRFYPSCLAGLLCCCPKRKLCLTAQGPRYDWGGHHFWKSFAVVIETSNKIKKNFNSR